MIARTAALALIAASLPVTPAQSSAGAIAVPLCSGGAISIPLGDDPAPLPEPCPLKACHAGSCRKQFDRSQ
ncbi:hypothetical protein [Altererythrobacter sp. BO-6]|uniref:hypothetical protein n=1 Tax=Altererythrobacter sp. BO-6 TaxID=2604537 RepID=UPI001F49D82C|nr:hypothetical protein [Altererythrobacter sp. BO-6]